MTLPTMFLLRAKKSPEPEAVIESCDCSRKLGQLLKDRGPKTLTELTVIAPYRYREIQRIVDSHPWFERDGLRYRLSWQGQVEFSRDQK